MKRRGPPLALLLALAAGGCTMAGNPMDRAGSWRPTGANQANLAAEVANPHDLLAGEEASGTPGPLAVLPVENLRAGKRKELPEDSAGTLGGTASPSGGGSAAAGAGS